MIKVLPEKAQRTFFVKNGDKSNFPLISIGRESYINSMEIHNSPGNECFNIQIGSFTSIAYNILVLVNRNHDYKSITTSPSAVLGLRKPIIKQKGQIIIGHDVWIGNDVILLSGVHIGSGAVIGAGSVIAKDVPPYAIVVGNPARIVKYRFSADVIEKLLRIAWWNWSYEKFQQENEYFVSGDVEQFVGKFYNSTLKKRAIVKTGVNNEFLFVPDVGEPYPIWDKVIAEFIQKSYRSTLTISLEPCEGVEDFLNKVREYIEEQMNKERYFEGTIKLQIKVLEEEDFLYFSSFVTTRNINMLKYIEWANWHGVKIISGVDIPVFD